MGQKGKRYLRMLALTAFILIAGLGKGAYVCAAETEDSSQEQEDSGGEGDAAQNGAEDTQQPDQGILPEQEEENWKVTVDASGMIKVSLKGYWISNAYLILREHAQNGYEVVTLPDLGGSVYFFDGNGYGRKYLDANVVPILGDLGRQYYYVENGAVSVPQSNRYVVCGNYMYEIRPSGEAVVRIVDKDNPGVYRRIVRGMCYQVSYRTGEANKYTGVFRDIIYKNGKVGTSDRAYYIIYKKHYCKVSKSGNVSVYVKDKKKKGTYKKNVAGICYQISYKTGEAKKYTGWYKDKYYKKGILYTGWVTIASERYYLERGVQKAGWTTIGKNQYYFTKAGIMLKNQMIGNCYVDKQGVRVNDKVINLAIKFVNSHSSASRSRAVRLKECYDYLWQKIPYNRTYGVPGRADMDDIAYSMLRNKYGNCFCYASTFAYIARVLGYESRVTVGELHSRRGGMTPHGWAEIYVNGQWLFCDPDMQMNYPNINSYMRTEEQYRYTHNIHHRYYLKTSNGKVKWKK